MEIIISSISRELVNAYADNKVIHVATTNQYDIDFLILVNGETIESNLVIEHNRDDLSFSEAEQLIKDVLVSEV